ncbi:DUF2304 family protein [Candidatus Gracilibacteria bacterium]|nr:DUF2304 family protein [Candidatus Gracilibacteria bacterium]NUJ99011.1 DUF2304 family protein [Candidatus Gracilibacteria bacterium]
MNLLELFFTVSGIVIFILGLDIARRQKFNALHFFIFLSIGSGLLVFTFFPRVLNFVGQLFGLQRGADLLVYSSIIFLIYFSLLLLRKTEENRSDLTKIVREIAIENSPKTLINGEYVFVVPAYNEEKVIYEGINKIIERGYENIIVINDGSTDRTKFELEKFGNKLIVLNHFKNRGQGAALETGFEYIRRYGAIKFVISFDSDGQHSLDDIKFFEEAIQSNKDAMIFLGSRFKGVAKNINFTRKLILKLGIMFTFVISHIKLSDTHNGYRFIKKEALNDIKITIDGMGHASEIIDTIATKGIKFLEVPVTIHYDEYSKAKGQKSSNAINIALRFIWNKFFK